MSVYILLGKSTIDSDRRSKEPVQEKDVKTSFEEDGVRILEKYATLGQYDFVYVVEAKDNEAINKVSLKLCPKNTIDVKVLPAIPVDNFIEALKSSKEEFKKAAN